MANLTDEERLAKGQYQDANGQWYTPQGLKITRRGEDYVTPVTTTPRDTPVTMQGTNEAADRMRNATDMQGTNYAVYDAKIPQGNYQALTVPNYTYQSTTTYPYFQEAVDAQNNAYAAALRQIELQQKRIAEQNRISKEAAEEQRNAALQQALLQYGANQDAVRQSAEEAARQAYVSRMLQERDLAQRLSAAGYSGGLTDSAYLRLANNYENSRNSIMTDRDRQLAALALAMDNERAQAAADIANANAKYDLSYNDALSDLAIQQANLEYQNQQALAQLYAQMREESASGSATGGSSSSSRRRGGSNPEGDSEGSDADAKSGTLGDLLDAAQKRGVSNDQLAAMLGLGQAAASIGASAALNPGAGALINAYNTINSLYGGRGDNSASAQTAPAAAAASTPPASTPSAAASSPSRGRYTRNEAAALVRSRGGTPTQKIQYLNSLAESGDITNSVFNGLAALVSRGEL